MVRLPLFYSDLYTGAISVDARFPRDRYRGVREELARRGLDEQTDLAEPPRATREELLLVHDPEYVDRFLGGELTQNEIRRIGFRPWKPEFQERTLAITGGSIAATRRALDGAGIAGNLAGGTHHAFRGHGEGYCVFNDLAICAEIARREYGVERIFVLDLDVHQGNGTAEIFADDPGVFTYSLHCGKNYPFRKQDSDRDVVLPEEAGDDELLESIESTVPALLHQVQPQLILYQSGTDALAEDALGRLRCTRDGLRRRNTFVFDYAGYWDSAVVITMGGGYSDPIDHSVQAHADVYEEAVARLLAAG